MLVEGEVSARSRWKTLTIQGAIVGVDNPKWYLLGLKIDSQVYQETQTTLVLEQAQGINTQCRDLVLLLKMPDVVIEPSRKARIKHLSQPKMMSLQTH